jgi:hypothetical protein
MHNEFQAAITSERAGLKSFPRNTSIWGSLASPLGLRISRCFLLAAAAGLVWRLVRFALHFELTGDEFDIVRSVLERDYAALLKPLDYNNVSPPGFLWLTKFMLSVFHCDWGARLVPFLAGLGAVAMFWLLCRETLRGSARWAAWALFCVSYVPVTEGTRSKGYSLDLLLATVMLWWLLRWLRERDKWRYLVWLTLCAPVFVWLSYTAVFVIGTAGLIWAAALVQSRLEPKRTLEPGAQLSQQERRHRSNRQNAGKDAGAPGGAALWLWLAFVTLAGVSALVLYESNIHAALQRSHAVSLDAFWGAGFPPLQQPWKLPWWLLTVHTGRGFAWPVGDNHFASSLTFGLWLTGLVVYWRRGNRWAWWVFVTAQGLLLAAACWHKYPYLANPRLCMFLGPGICLFVGAGLQYWIARRPWESRHGWYRFAAGVFLLCALGGLTRELALRVHELKGTGHAPRPSVAELLASQTPTASFIPARGNAPGKPSPKD